MLCQEIRLPSLKIYSHRVNLLMPIESVFHCRGTDLSAEALAQAEAQREAQSFRQLTEQGMFFALDFHCASLAPLQLCGEIGFT